MNISNTSAPTDIGVPEAVRKLLAARQSRTPVPSSAVFSGAVNPERGYELAALHSQAMLERIGGQVIGIKLAGGDLAAMQSLGLLGQFRGPIFSALTFDSPAQLNREDFFICMVEAEIGFVMGEDIGGSSWVPDRAALIRSIAALVPCIEIADSRYSDFAQCAPAAALADLAFAGAWVRGAPALAWQDVDLAQLHVKLLSNQVEVRSGSGARAMGNPLDALEAMITDMGRSGQKLKAGQVVSTGTYTAPYPVKRGEALVAEFGPFGSVSLSFD